MSVDLGFITTRPMPIKALDIKPPDMNHVNYLRREIYMARERASAADTLGRYDMAAFYEDRAEELARELKEVIKNGRDK